jgi:AcrR family transcriptional regulator
VSSQSKIGNKRDRILLAAKRLFVNQGINLTPTSAIAIEAGVANGTLFHYFKTKEELIHTLYHETCQSHALITNANVDKEKTIKRKFHVLWYNTVRWGLNRPQDFFFMQQIRHAPRLSCLSGNEMPDHLQLIRSLIQQGKEKGTLKDIPTALLCQLSQYQLFAVINFLLQHDEYQQNAKYVSMTFDFFWDSISKKHNS